MYILLVQPTLKPPTRLSHLLTKNQFSTSKSEVKHDCTPQPRSSSDSKDSFNQPEIVQQQSSNYVNEKRPLTDKKDNAVVTDVNRQAASTVKKQSKNDIPVSYSQTELATKDSDVSHTSVHHLQFGSELATATTTATFSTATAAAAATVVANSMVKERSTLSEIQCSNSIVSDDACVEEVHHKGVVSSTSTTAPQSSSIVVQSHKEYTDMSDITKIPSKPSVGKYNKHHSEDNVSISPSGHPQSHDEYEDEQNIMFEELFGSSGEEDDGDAIEDIIKDDSDDMESEVHHEVEQRKAEEEFKRITSHSANTPQISVSS